MVGTKSDLIFITLPKNLIVITIFLRKLNYNVFYLKLSGTNNIEEEKYFVTKLKQHGIIPLPLEELSHFQGFSEIYFDNEQKVMRRTNEIAPISFLKKFEDNFPDNINIAQLLQNEVRSLIAIQMMEITGKINLWANANPNRKHIIIDTDIFSLITPELADNVRLLIIPIKFFESCVNKFINIIKKIFAFHNKGKSNNKKQIPHQNKIKTIHKPKYRVAFVVHNGLEYGKLFHKDIFYSRNIESELHPERLLHIDYSGFSTPSEKLKWICMGNHRQSWISNLFYACVVLRKGFLHIHHLKFILTLFIIVRIYIIFRSYSKKLEAYPNLKIALIDYEILCPKELLLAFEEKGIITIALQERFILAFEQMYCSIFLNNYLCVSQYVSDTMRKTQVHNIDNYYPIGQYRADILSELKQKSPSQILKVPLAKGLRIITALGFHTHMEWHNSQVDPLLNWKAHQHFLDDMFNLSNDIPGVFIVLRYKSVDWMKLPIFKECIQKIISSENITISIDYDNFNISYDLCAHSDLVIAKHTSLADECLSVGIPVLFHEYTHNTNRIMADSFDYSPTKIMCYNYEELLERARIVLSDTPNEMTADYEYLRKVVYGNLGDGKVKERVHAFIEGLLSEEENTK